MAKKKDDEYYLLIREVESLKQDIEIRKKEIDYFESMKARAMNKIKHYADWAVDLQ